MLGVLSNKEVLIALSRGRIGLDDVVTGAMRPADFMPETVTVSDAFDTMQDKRLSMMLVTNEYGGIAGLVTAETDHRRDSGGRGGGRPALGRGRPQHRADGGMEPI